MSTGWEKELAELAELVHNHSSVQAYQSVREVIATLSDVKETIRDMKHHQQKAVFFDKITKPHAYDSADQQAHALEEELTQLPIVQQYRQDMQNASDLLQYVTRQIEEEMNKEENS